MSDRAGPAAIKREGSDGVYRFDTTRQAREPASNSDSDSGSDSDSDLPEVTLTPSTPAAAGGGGRFATYKEERAEKARLELASVPLGYPGYNTTFEEFEEDVFDYVARMLASARGAQNIREFRVNNESHGYNILLPTIDSTYFKLDEDTPPPPSLNVEEAIFHFYKRENLLEAAGRIPHEDTRTRYQRIERRVKALKQTISHDFRSVFGILKGLRLPFDF